MALVVLPRPLLAGTKARGSHVLENDATIALQVNGNLEDVNYKNASMTLSTKAVPLSCTTGVLANDVITQAKVADEAIQPEHLKNDAARPPTGIGSPRNELFTESDNAAITNVIGGRKQHGGKTITAYFQISAVATAVLVDDSMDWRRRIISVIAWIAGDNTGTKRFLPNGANDDILGNSVWNAIVGGFAGTNAGIFYSEAGRVDAGTTQPHLTMGWSTTANSALMFFANDLNGDLRCKTGTSFPGGVNEVNVIAIITAGPYLGT